MPCQGAHGTMGCCPCHGPTCCKAREGLAHVSQAPPCLPQSSCCSNTPCCVLVSLICNNELWHWTHGLSFPCTGHCTLVQRISHASKLALWLQHHHALSKTFLSAATCHGIVPMAHWATLMHQVLHPCASTRERRGCTTLCALTATRCMPHMSWSPCVGASILFRVLCPCLSHALMPLAAAKAQPWCLPWVPSPPSFLPSLPPSLPLKEHFKPF